MTAILVDGSLLLSSDPTGIGSYTRALAMALVQAGVQVDLLLSGLTRPESGGAGIDLANQELRVRHVRRRGLRKLRRLWNTRGGLKRTLPAIRVPIQGNSSATLSKQVPECHAIYNAKDFLAHSQAIFALWRGFTRIALTDAHDAVHWTVPAPVFVRGTPNIYTIHDMIPVKFPQFTLDRRGRAASLHTMIARQADHIVTVSERSKEDIKSALHVPDDRITVAYPAAPAFPQIEQSDAERLISTVYDARPGSYVFFCGAIEPKKNLSRLIEAFIMADTGQQLLIAGPLGWLYDDVQDLIGRTAKSGVRYLGYLPRLHIGALIQCASFFAFPSLYEGFGIPVLEAMQVGTPVLTSHAGSLPEVAGDAALMVDPLNVTAMAGAIRRLAADADLANELSRRGRNQAKQFTIERFSGSLASAYRAVGVDFTARAPDIQTRKQSSLSVSGEEGSRSAVGESLA